VAGGPELGCGRVPARHPQHLPEVGHHDRLHTLEREEGQDLRKIAGQGKKVHQFVYD